MSDAKGTAVFVDLAATTALLCLEEFPFPNLQRLKRTVLTIKRLAFLKRAPQAVGIRAKPSDVAVKHLELDVAHAAMAESARELAELVLGIVQVDVDVVKDSLD